MPNNVKLENNAPEINVIFFICNNFNFLIIFLFSLTLAKFRATIKHWPLELNVITNQNLPFDNFYCLR